MINRNTVAALGLQPVTRSMCRDFYVKINTEFDGPEAILESVSWWQDDGEKLNRLWWVLNYYSDRLDPDRNLRACVEKRLNILAELADPLPETDARPEEKSGDRPGQQM